MTGFIVIAMTCPVTTAPFTPAGRQLKDWIETNSSQSDVARTLGVSQPTVSAWVNGRTRPEPHLRDALVALAGISVADWELPEERQQREAAMGRIREGAA